MNQLNKDIKYWPKASPRRQEREAENQHLGREMVGNLMFIYKRFENYIKGNLKIEANPSRKTVTSNIC